MGNSAQTRICELNFDAPLTFRVMLTFYKHLISLEIDGSLILTIARNLHIVKVKLPDHQS